MNNHWSPQHSMRKTRGPEGKVRKGFGWCLFATHTHSIGAHTTRPWGLPRSGTKQDRSRLALVWNHSNHWVQVNDDDDNNNTNCQTPFKSPPNPYFCLENGKTVWNKILELSEHCAGTARSFRTAKRAHYSGL